MSFMKKLSYSAATIALLAAAPAAVHAQATSSSMRGTVTDGSGNLVSGARVTIMHVPSGSLSSTSTTANGVFNASGLRVGGPYAITVTAPGYQPSRIEDVYLSLGDTLSLDINLDSGAETADVIVVTASAIQTVQTAVGPNSTFNLADLQNAPAINRDLSDVVRQDPRIYIDESYNNSIQCAGANPRYNSLTVDGLALNDGFGLNSNGYPTQRMPFSYDAIEQVSVELAPFDVQYGGFTACNINAVTKSGTNEFHGGFFYDYTDDGFQGDSLEGSSFDVAPYDQKRYGVTFGGPILQDRLFFFAAYEKFEGQDLFDRGPEGSGMAREVTGFTQADYDEILDIAQNIYGYDPGGIPAPAPFEDESLLVRFDWNVNEDHRVAFTYNQSEGLNLTQSDGDSNEFEYFNHLYNRGSELKSYSAQIFSDWTDNFSTELRATLTDVDFTQSSVNGTDFGEVQIRHNGNTIYLGADDSRHANALNYETLTLKAVANYQWNNHLFSFGAERLSYDIFNQFVQHVEGEWRFNSIDDFRNGDVSRIYYGNARGTNDPTDASASFAYDINTVYAQDEWTVPGGFTFVAGLRYDWYTSDDVPNENANFIARNGFSNADSLDGRGLLQPRFAATWDFNDQLTLRAGFGLYSGGNPNVWVSNNYSNDGLTNVQLTDYAPENLLTGSETYVEDEGGLGRPIWGVPESMYNNVATGAANSSVNAIDPDFEIPSEWKFALGFTYQGALPFIGDGYTVVGDFLRSETQYAAGIIDATLEQVDTAPDGRPIYRSIDRSDPDCVDPTSPNCSGRVFNQDFILTNFDGGYQNVLSLAVSNDYDFGLDWTLAYAYVDAEDSNPMTSSVAYSNYANIAVSDPNDPAAATSNYEIPHRFTARVSYEHAFFADYMSRVSLFGQISQSRPYSYAFTGDDGDIFGDIIDRRHLLYVPTDENDPNVVFAPTFDTAGFFQFVDENGLPRGEIAGRNAFEGSWWTKFDLRFEPGAPGSHGRSPFGGLHGHQECRQPDQRRVGHPEPGQLPASPRYRRCRLQCGHEPVHLRRVLRPRCRVPRLQRVDLADPLRCPLRLLGRSRHEAREGRPPGPPFFVSGCRFPSRAAGGCVIEARPMTVSNFPPPVHIPHETAPVRCIFTCWPSAADLWEEHLEPAQAEFAGFLKALTEPSVLGETLDLVVLAATAQAEASARQSLGSRAQVVREAFGDVWARDTGPVFLTDHGEPTAVRFRFNGWGGKYDLPGDDTVGGAIARLAGARERTVNLVAEGGALEFDGEGTLITTRQCLLNPNRNPGLSEAEVTDRLKSALGIRKVLWIDEGLGGRSYRRPCRQYRPLRPPGRGRLPGPHRRGRSADRRPLLGRPSALAHDRRQGATPEGLHHSLSGARRSR